MKAAVCTAFGALEIREVEKPAPQGNEVLVRLHATTICAADYRVRRAYPLRWILAVFKAWKPDILGMEVAGTVESVGKGVTRFRAGDLVFGGTGFKLGAHAEYACVRETQLELKPVNMSLEEAAAVVFGGLTALCFIRLAKIQPGQNVLVYGASGSVGVFAVQLAKHFGAHVTGVSSTANLALVKSLGADQVVDYTKEDFSETGQTYDAIFDAVGKAGHRRSLKCLKRGAPYVIVAPSGGILSILGDIPRQQWISLTGAAKIVGGVTRPADGDLAFLRSLIEAGTLRTVIDRCYSFDQISEAFDYAEKRHKKGHVVILLEPTAVSEDGARPARPPGR